MHSFPPTRGCNEHDYRCVILLCVWNGFPLRCMLGNKDPLTGYLVTRAGLGNLFFYDFWLALKLFWTEYIKYSIYHWLLPSVGSNYVYGKWLHRQVWILWSASRKSPFNRPFCICLAVHYHTNAISYMPVQRFFTFRIQRKKKYFVSFYGSYVRFVKFLPVS
jgi:hypothetical protein